MRTFDYPGHWPHRNLSGVGRHQTVQSNQSNKNQYIDLIGLQRKANKRKGTFSVKPTRLKYISSLRNLCQHQSSISVFKAIQITVAAIFIGSLIISTNGYKIQNSNYKRNQNVTTSAVGDSQFDPMGSSMMQQQLMDIPDSDSDDQSETTSANPFGAEMREQLTRTNRQTSQSQIRANKCALILQRTFVSRPTSSSSSSATISNRVDGVKPNAELNDENQASGYSDIVRQRQTNQRQPRNQRQSRQQSIDDNPVRASVGGRELICIRYADVDEAIDEALRSSGYTTVQELVETLNGASEDNESLESLEPSVAIISALGELNQLLTLQLAAKFGLSHDEILNGLPMIDMSATKFWPLCPASVRPLDCSSWSASRYRSPTGHCNNVENPAWGASQTPFSRYLAPAHPDGVQSERASVVDGSALPSPRLVTSLVHRDHDVPSSDLSLLIMSWGQIIDHDVALAAPPRDENGMDFNCCRREHPNCMPIRIPDRDPFYSKFGQTCMDFKRSLAGLRPNCALGPRVHINTITSTIDANTVYGSTKRIADQLRAFKGGLLRVQDVFTHVGMKPLLPPQTENPDLDCFERNKQPDGRYCFLGGDDRVNEQPTLTILHTLYVRDHNRLATELGRLNPHWNDEKIYQETRHIEAAIIQHLVLAEYLPELIGHDMMQMYNLTEAPPGQYWDQYQSSVSPTISHAFSTAAFRQGHTFIQGKLRLHNANTHEYLGFDLLRRLFKRPWHYYEPGRMDQVLAGLLNTPAQTYDPFITEEISGHLFQEAGQSFGMDLPAINLARGREQGTPGYNAFREWCGLPRARTFSDLINVLNNRTAHHYSRVYKHVDDIDLWSAGVSERRMPGAQIGATFACIIARQFGALRAADRYWFERGPDTPSAFTLEQLAEIKKTSQARLFCANADNLQSIQRQALRLPHPVYNPRVPCSQIADLDLTYWQETI